MSATRLRVCCMGAVALLGLAGCGSGGQGARSYDSNGFANQTNGAVSDARLVQMWGNAQTQIATSSFALNPVPVSLSGGTMHMAGPDARAMQVQPDGIAVIAVTDIPVASLPAEFQNKGYSDPTGVIDQCNDVVHYCHSSAHGNTVYVATSLAGSDGATGWEFQNIILQRLGYNVSGR